MLRLRSLLSAARLASGFVSRQRRIRQGWHGALSLVESGACAGISIDCFDTLLARGVPDWEQLALAEIAGSATGHSAGQSRQFLHAAIGRARRLAPGDREPGAALIWTEYCATAGIPPHVATLLADHELKLLETTSLASAEAMGFIAAVEKCRLPWVVSSDTRWPRAALSRLLTGKGFAVAAKSIFASCDHHQSKFRGGLYSIAYQHMIGTLGRHVPRSDFLHVGDNFLADVCSAACFGMLAIQVPPAPRMPPAAVDGEPVQSLLAGARQEIADSLR